MRFPFHTNVVGVTSACSVDERLVLVRDHNNRHDHHAIIVARANGEQIGFIRSDVAVELAPYMARWTTLSAKVDDLTCGAGETREIGIVIYEVAGAIEQAPGVGDGRLPLDAKSGQADLRHARHGSRDSLDSFARWIRRWLSG